MVGNKERTIRLKECWTIWVHGRRRVDIMIP